tara:strand:- start:1884 stop:2159 length:276 start_codon:yes stop_codon:yes gene_type:complete
MSKVIHADFGSALPNTDRFIDEIQPLLEELVDVACGNLGEELGCLMIQSICTSMSMMVANLSDCIENKEKYILNMENGDIIDINLDSEDSE